MKHWIAVISLEHAQIAAQSNFLQVCHGKRGPLQGTSSGDEVFIYCPRNRMKSGQPLKLVAFRCIFKNNNIYQVKQAPGFEPFRKDVIFDKLFQPVGIKEIVSLSFTRDPSWGMLARRGFFEISADDAHRIREKGYEQTSSHYCRI